MKPVSFRFKTASLTHPGRIRTLNEDGAVVDAELGFAIVTDGMGGHRAGETASQLALSTLAGRLRARLQGGSLPSAEWLRETIAATNTLIHAAALQQLSREGMGATLAMAVLQDRQAILAHVGDSRIYRLRDGRLELLTRDDSMLNDQIELGVIAAEDAGDSRNRHFVTQALGMAEQVDVHIREEQLVAGDVYLLCTDGLNDLVGDADIELILDALKTNLPLTASHLVQLANDSGGYDNIAVALLHVVAQPAQAAPRNWLGRLFARLAH